MATKTQATGKQVRPYEPRPGSYLTVGLPDIHFPDHDRLALACALGAIQILKPKEVGFYGDVLNCEGFGRHAKTAVLQRRFQTFNKAEIQPCNRMLDWVSGVAEHVWFLEGNHENNVERKIMELGEFGQEIADLISPRKLISEGRKNFTYVEYVQKPGAELPHYRIAKDLVAVHGWSHSKNCAAKHLEMARNFSVVFGHVHRAQSHTVRQPIDRRRLKAWSPGCLAQLQPLYARHDPTDAVHGFDLIWVTEDKQKWTSFTVEVQGGVCILPDGRKVDGKEFLPLLREIEG